MGERFYEIYPDADLAQMIGCPKYGNPENDLIDACALTTMSPSLSKSLFKNNLERLKSLSKSI